MPEGITALPSLPSFKIDLRNKRGFTPFGFSSREIQMNATQLGGLLPENPVSDFMNDAVAWYEMWVNPEKVSLKRKYMQKQTYTAGSIVTYHYRPETIDMTVSGKVGWILNPNYPQQPSFLSQIVPGNIVKSDSPRIFLERLRNLADAPMYFVGMDGIEHYNTKFIKIYTKQYPNGVICEGYFKDFEVPESGEDPQTVEYRFNFVVEIMTPVSILQNIAGMLGIKMSGRSA